jgi:hypothetical protein
MRTDCALWSCNLSLLFSDGRPHREGHPPRYGTPLPARREGWTRQIQSAKALAKREDALTATPIEAVAMSMRERAERHLERMAGVSERGVDHIETMDGPGILRSIDQIDKLDKVARRTFQLDDTQATGQITLNVLNVAGDLACGWARVRQD